MCGGRDKVFACMRRARENVRACVRLCQQLKPTRNNLSNSFNSALGMRCNLGRPTKGLIFMNVVGKLILACKRMFADDKPKDDKPKVSAFTGKGAKLGNK